MLVLSLGSCSAGRRRAAELGGLLASPWPWPPLSPAGPTAHPGGVDRRFNRRRYDAARTIEVFSGRLRQQTDLATLATELLQVVHRTVEPPQRRSGLDPARGVQRDRRCSRWHRSGC
jgi:hypothetical protein